MTPHSSIPALAVSFALLGVVAWIAVSHPGEGRLFATSALHTEVDWAAQPTAPASTSVAAQRSPAALSSAP